MVKIPELKSAFSPQEIGNYYDRILKKPFASIISLEELYMRRINELTHSLGMTQLNSSYQPSQISKP